VHFLSAHTTLALPLPSAPLFAFASLPPRCIASEHRDSIPLVRLSPQAGQGADPDVATATPRGAGQAQAELSLPGERRDAEFAEEGHGVDRRVLANHGLVVEAHAA